MKNAKKQRVAVLGAGMVGRSIARDLNVRFEVTSFDADPVNLNMLKEAGVATSRINLMEYSKYEKLLSEYAFVVCALPGFMGYDALEAVIKAKKNVVDISFFPENSLQLDALAKEKNVIALVDFGLAPGMSNLILGYHNERMKVQNFECLVGGLPKVRIKPFEYKAPFSPIDVIEEYTRDARYVENGSLVVKPALSDAELINFEQVGTLESFNTDGLRTLIDTMPHIPNMIEKTLRYPGHIDLIIALKQAGFFSEDKIIMDGTAISRKNFTCKVLFDQWKLNPEDEEFTLMRVKLSGLEDEKEKKITYYLYDEYKKDTSTSSMSRTTAYTCAAAVNMLADGLYSETGVNPPEYIGKDKKCFDFIIEYLKERGVNWQRLS